MSWSIQMFWILQVQQTVNILSTLFSDVNMEMGNLLIMDENVISFYIMKNRLLEWKYQKWQDKIIKLYIIIAVFPLYLAKKALNKCFQSKTVIQFHQYPTSYSIFPFSLQYFSISSIMEILSQKENSIFLKNKMTSQDLLTLKQRDIESLTKQLELISPKKHRFFKKQYVLEADYCQYELLISDIEDYYNLLTNQANKINVFLRDYSVDQFLQNLFRCFSAFSLEFCKKTSNIVTKISKRSEKSEVKYETQSSLQCGGCKQNIYDYRFQKLKQQLNLNHFEDRYHFFNVDNINYSELDALKRESNNIIQSQLGENENAFLYKGNCISLEQYQQVLNLLGSDLHQKNTHIEKIIEYLSQTDRKLISQDHFKQRESEEEMKVMEKIVKDDTIKGKLKEMIVTSLRKFVKNKLGKMVDCQVQANIKENEIIRELQRQKKAIKTKYMVLFKEKQRLVTEYDGKIKRLHLQLDTTKEDFKKEINKITQQGATTAQKYLQASHMNETYRLQILHLTSQNTHLIASLNKQVFLQKERDTRQSHSGNGSRQQGTKKMKNKARIKKSIQKDVISLAETVSQIQFGDKDLDSATDFKGNDRRKNRKNSISRKTSLALNHNPSQSIITSLRDTYKYGTYQKIDEKQEQEEFDDKLQSQNSLKNKDQKPKMSRFKAIMTHFNSSSLAQQLNEDQCAQKNEILKDCTEFKSQKVGNLTQQLKGGSKGQLRISQDSEKNCVNNILKANLLQHLFESEKDNGRVSIQLNSFLQKYEKFISQIMAQKSLGRSTSLKVHDITRRKNRVSTKYDLSKPIITSKSIEEATYNNNCQEKSNKKSSSSSKRFKLQKIDRKSQKELKKITKPKNQFYFTKPNSKTADNTQRSDFANKTVINILPPPVNNSLSNSRADTSPVNSLALLTEQEIMSLFLNIKNIDNFSQQVDKQQIDPLAPMESQVLMKIYAQLAHIHLKNVKSYEQLKKIIFYPKQTLQNKQILSKKQSINHLKASLHFLTKIHRFCHKPKGSQQCLHLSSFLEKLITLSSTSE